MALKRPRPPYVRDAGRRSLIGTKLLAGMAIVLGFARMAESQVQPPIAGQNSGTTRSIEGRVLDASKNSVASAVVLLKDTKTLQVRSYIAQADGRYHFYGLSTDINYQLRAEANGFTSKTKTVSVFDSHKVIKLDLKVTKKMKP